jgi:hypothetical protein
MMTGRHPEAVGSYGAEAVEWIDAQAAPLKLRWWQRLVVYRALEHREDGSLCWETVWLSTTRQVGKSTLARWVIQWRMEHGHRFGNAQPDTCLFTARHLDVSREVLRPAMVWAMEQPRWVTRQANGEQRIEHPNGARWLVRAVNAAGYGFTLSLAFVDEAWDVAPAVVDDQLAPTQITVESPQLWLISTAHPEATELMPGLRKAGLLQLDQPDSLLLMEWSGHPAREPDDLAGWREASPYWDAKRESFLRKQWVSSTSEESWRAQWLNQWPKHSRLGLVDEDSWAGMATPGLKVPGGVPLVLALEAIGGGGVTLVKSWKDPAGKVCLKAEHRLTLIKALTEAHQLAADRPGTTLLLGANLDKMVARDAFPGEVVLCGIRETRQATHLFQGLAVEQLLCHDGDPVLAKQITGAAVVASESGPVMSGTRSPVPVDAARCSLWVTWAHLTIQGASPAIY